MWKGIDVSDNQGVIDWEQAAAAGVQFAILRSVRRSGKADSQFASNLAGCRKYGIPMAVYKYTYATTAAEVREEARQVTELLQASGLTGTMVWWDVEDRDTLQPLGTVRLTELIRTAQEEIGKAGYCFGIYTGLYVYREGWFDFGAFACPLWIARYPSSAQKKWDDEPLDQDKPSVGRAIWGWQWTSNGRLPGIGGAVDFNVCYQDPEWTAEREAGAIYTVSVADVWTRAQAEEVQRQLAAIGIPGVVHKVKILE
ncbi:MAG TPA: hypothetical protein H9763_01515 [Candidatus Eisenbergiella merdigallinarum]|uniref:Lysozyme n=1 Tax=Candidatus Eisenbergiella merdigallinarum TaxID=2838552 RepID=A0A9D2MQ30_9FIRM|nr:hypothetical protein [Candidatus Eisenbergiella merdigallinarum]